MKKTTLLTICCFFFAFVFATDDKDNPIPLDPKVKHGKLDNGLSYYIRSNQIPKERAMFFLLVKAGAMNETTEQNGLAHFCEHMAFNGTKNFPDKGITNYLESIGVSFGGGLNAFTSRHETCYTLNNIPTTEESYIDSALMILADWSANVTYSDEEINNERGVIHEEWRTRGGANRRMSDQTNKVLFNDSKYSYHNVIGKLDVIDNCDPQLLRDFYHNWYRPDLQAVVVVGDIDEDEIQAKIEKLFGSIPKRETPPETVDYSVPENKEAKVGIATDKEAMNIRISLYMKHDTPVSKDMNYIKGNMLGSLYRTMLSNRYNELVTQSKPPFIGAYTGYGNYTKDCYSLTTSVTALNEDPIKSFTAAITEAERVKRHGFTQTELDRAKKQYLANAEKGYKEKDKQKSNQIVWSYYGHFLANDPKPGAEFNYNLTKEFIPGVQLEQVNQLNETYFNDENQSIILHAPEKENIIIPSKDELLLAYNSVKGSEILPYIDQVSTKPFISIEPVTSAVTTTTEVPIFGGTEWTLKNGAKVIWKLTDNKEDEIQMTAFSNGGTSLIETVDLPSSSMATTALREGGLGDLSKLNLKKYMTGKVVSVYPWISTTSEGLGGSSSVNDFNELLQLTYMHFVAPRKDKDAYDGYISRYMAYLENKKLEPRYTMMDSVSVICSNYHPRRKPTSKEYISQADFEKSFSIASDRIKDASDFTFIFVGNVNPEEMKPMVEKYIGGIPDINRDETWKDWGIRAPEGKLTKTFKRPMKLPRATTHIRYHGEVDMSPINNFCMSALSYILRMRYTEKVREEEGGTYGVGVGGSISSKPKDIYNFRIQYDSDPEKVEKLNEIIYAELEDMKLNGPTEEELNKAKEYFLKNKSERMKDNRHIMSLIRNYYENGFYSYSKENYEDNIESMSNSMLKDMANNVFGENVVEIIMLPE